MILLKISIDILFTPFGLQINKLGKENREKSDQLENVKNYTFIKFQKYYFWPYLDSTLSRISNGTKNA